MSCGMIVVFLLFFPVNSVNYFYFLYSLVVVGHWKFTFVYFVWWLIGFYFQVFVCLLPASHRSACVAAMVNGDGLTTKTRH